MFHVETNTSILNLSEFSPNTLAILGLSGLQHFDAHPLSRLPDLSRTPGPCDSCQRRGHAWRSTGLVPGLRRPKPLRPWQRRRQAKWRSTVVDTFAMAGGSFFSLFFFTWATSYSQNKWGFEPYNKYIPWLIMIFCVGLGDWAWILRGQYPLFLGNP